MNEKLVVGVELSGYEKAIKEVVAELSNALLGAEYAVIAYNSMYGSDTAMAVWLMKNADGMQVDR